MDLLSLFLIYFFVNLLKVFTGGEFSKDNFGPRWLRINFITAYFVLELNLIKIELEWKNYFNNPNG